MAGLLERKEPRARDLVRPRDEQDRRVGPLAEGLEAQLDAVARTILSLVTNLLTAATAEIHRRRRIGSGDSGGSLGGLRDVELGHASLEGLGLVAAAPLVEEADQVAQRLRLRRAER